MIGAPSVGRYRRLMNAGCRAAEVAALAATAALLTALSASAGSQPAAADAKARIAKWEQGPATIAVTNYPVAARESYKVFAARCSRCHALSRAINADYVLPDEWEPRVKRMMDKWFSGINEATRKRILDFLIYDASVRKKPLLDAALAKLSADVRKAAEDRIAEIRLRYEKESPAP